MICIVAVETENVNSSSLENDNLTPFLVWGFCFSLGLGGQGGDVVFFQKVVCGFFSRGAHQMVLLQKLFSRFYVSFPFGTPLCFTLAK